MAIRTSIIGNNFVGSSGNNVAIRIIVNPRCTSQDTQEESKGELMINFVISKQRKAIGTLQPKGQVVRKQWCHLIVSLLVTRPEKSELLKVFKSSIKLDMVNPTNPIKDGKGRAEDIRKSECQSVMDWTELSVKEQIRYSTGNGADFWLVLLIEISVYSFNQERC